MQPAIWVAVPLTLLFFHMEGFHGREPLPLDRDAIVTMGMRPGKDCNTLAAA